MPGGKSEPETKDTDPEFVRMYYEHQYDRIKKHEDQALTISNIVLTISALIITFGLNNRQSFGSVLVLFLPTVIIIANLFAIFYIRDNAIWIKLRRLRAKRILEIYAPELFIISNESVVTQKKNPVDRGRFQIMIHVLFIVLAVILVLLFILEALQVSIV